MNAEAIRRAALERMIVRSAEVEVLLSEHKSNVLIELLVNAREEAADAMVALAEVEAGETAKVRALQNDVKRYGDLMRWLRQMVTDGLQASKALGDEEREEFFEGVGLEPEALEARIAGTAGAEDR